MTTLEALLRAIVADPQTDDRWLVLADYLEEHDDPRRATLLRLHRRMLATGCEPERYPERAEWHARIVALLAEGVRPCLPQRTVVLGEGIQMDFNFIPPGTFLMGSPEGEEGRRPDEVLHRVTLTRGFWMGIYPVTQAQWKAVMGSNPSEFPGDDRPVEMVSWDDRQGFCSKLAETTGLRFVLPSEAVWEYACRAGTTTAYYTGDGVEALKRAGWCSDGKPGDSTLGGARETRPVGQFEPNAWGLFDMHGNVDEWCLDLSEEGGDDCVVRGGSWYDYPCSCRSASRMLEDPSSWGPCLGVRIVLRPDE